MFNIDISPAYYYPVEVQIVTDGGVFKKSKFDAQFKRLSKKETKDLFDRFNDKDAPMTDDILLEQVLVGWKGIQTPDQQELPFSQSTSEQVLNIQGVSTAITKAWLDSIQGAKAKN